MISKLLLSNLSQMETNIISPDNPLIQNVPQPKIRINSKYLIFTSLFILSLLLLILSTIINNQKNKLPPDSTPPVTTTPIPIITDIPKIAIPTEYQSIIDQINGEIRTQLEFNPPQIDENIGL